MTTEITTTTTRQITADTLGPLVDMVLDSVQSDHTKRQYSAALLGHIGEDGIMSDERGFLVWYARSGRKFGKAAVMAWRQHLVELGVGESSINIRLGAVRKLALECADNELISFDTVAAIKRVPNFKREGQRLGNWLTTKQAARLVQVPDVDTIKGQRDRAILALLIGCGLRRAELCNLTFEHIQQREGRWVLVDVIGKRNKMRSVPAPAWAVHFVHEWAAAAAIEEGAVFRPVLKGGRVQEDAMTAQAVRNAVKDAGRKLGVDIAPHDLRRTFARLSHTGGADMRQIQLSLGHSSIETTERYIGANQSLTSAPCDFLGIKL